MTEHVPALAATNVDGEDPRRSLVLAGGGMRVAYQAGSMLALEEGGLRFAHADGTSGGTINLAMLLSGLTPAEMCERWRTLNPKDFGSPLSVREYLKAPRLAAFGDADGVIGKVFPHLGIDVARIREARGLDGTFNACNFTRKTNESVPHTDVDLELLVAGISLPIFMPPVRRGADLYTDSVWIKDANLTQAVQRGAEEIWLVWCIGNTGVYRDGAFNQYVHMIELAANGSLFEEFDRIVEQNERRERPVRLHVIRPEYPIPLDPDFYLGRIHAGELVELGYRDAKAYLERMQPEGVPWTPDATRMRDPALGVSFAEHMTGSLGESPLEVSLRVEIRDLDAFIDGPTREGEVTGHVDHASLGGRVLVKAGRFAVEQQDGDKPATLLEYTLELEPAGEECRLVVRKELRDDPGFDLWDDLTTGHATLERAGATPAAVDLRTHPLESARRVVAWNAETEREKVAAIARFGRFVFGDVWERFV